MGVPTFLYVSGSVVLTMAFLAVGMSFFGPYWLSNLSVINTAYVQNNTWFMPAQTCIGSYNNPDRGLWAQCGLQCIWFWKDDYCLQRGVFTPLKWHLATQILYFIAATLILFSEFYARVQWCCRSRKGVYLSLSLTLFVSAVIQTAAVAVFGGGASRDYSAISDPAKFTQYLGQPNPSPTTPVYLGWGFWMAVVGDMLTVVAAVLFLLARLCFSKEYE